MSSQLPARATHTVEVRCNVCGFAKTANVPQHAADTTLRVLEALMRGHVVRAHGVPPASIDVERLEGPHVA